MAIATRQSQSPTSSRPVTRSRPARWEPFQELEQLTEQVGRLMDFAWSPTADGETWVPPVDIEETEDAWIVEAEVPSARRDDINVELRESELVISGEIKEKERQGVLRRRTRRTGRFEYRVTLPGQTEPDKIEARLHDGVLTVRVPKSEKQRPQRIEVRED